MCHDEMEMGLKSLNNGIGAEIIQN